MDMETLPILKDVNTNLGEFLGVAYKVADNLLNPLTVG